MAEEWTKIRVSLDSDPKVIAIAQWLRRQPDFVAWATGGSVTVTRDISVTVRVTVCVTVTALSRVWSVTRRDGREVGEDLVVPFATLETIDEISGVPRLGEAMSRVGWVVRCDETDCLILPKFFRHNASTDELRKKQAAERQRRRRDKSVTRHAGVTRDSHAPVTPMSRTEGEREGERETKKEGEAKKGLSSFPLSGADDLAMFPEVVQPEGELVTLTVDAAVNELIATWNGLAGVNRFSRTALTYLQRSKVRDWVTGHDKFDWRAALRKFPLACFSETGGFKPTLGWFLKDDNAAEVLEGKFDWRKGARPKADFAGAVFAGDVAAGVGEM
jgi:hypothetical protein